MNDLQMETLGYEFGRDTEPGNLSRLLAGAYAQACDHLDIPDPMTTDEWYHLIGVFIGAALKGNDEHLRNVFAARADAERTTP